MLPLPLRVRPALKRAAPTFSLLPPAPKTRKQRRAERAAMRMAGTRRIVAVTTKAIRVRSALISTSVEGFVLGAMVREICR